MSADESLLQKGIREQTGKGRVKGKANDIILHKKVNF